MTSKSTSSGQGPAVLRFELDFCSCTIKLCISVLEILAVHKSSASLEAAEVWLAEVL